jgi:hypothetical protein
MIRRSLALFALGLALAAGTGEATAQCCNCAISCWGPAPVTIWGLSPAYRVNQGPVFSGPGYTTLPSYEGEAPTYEYPYVGYEGGYVPYGHPYYRPYDGGPYSDPLRHHVHHGYWHDPASLRPYPNFYRHGFYRHGWGPRVLGVRAGTHGTLRIPRIERD